MHKIAMTQRIEPLPSNVIFMIFCSVFPMRFLVDAWASTMHARATIDKTCEKYYLLDRQFRTSCRSRVSVNSGSSSSSTTLLQESLGPDAHVVSGNRAASSSSSGSVLERSDELATRKLEQESLRSDKKDENDPLADLPLWLQDFTDNLDSTDVHAPAHIAQDSDSEHPTKVVTKSRKHSIYTHFPKDQNCEVCLRTKIKRAPCRRRTGETLPPAEKIGDFITADHKVLNEGCESRDNHRYAVVVQDLASLWVQAYPCKTKSSHEPEKKL